MPAPVYEGLVNGLDGSGTSWALAAPTRSVGDKLSAVCYVLSTSKTIPTPAGWALTDTITGATSQLRFYDRIGGASNTSTDNFSASWSGSAYRQSAMLRFSGAATSTYHKARPNFGASSTMTALEAITETPDCLAIWVGGTDAAPSFGTPTAGMTRRVAGPWIATGAAALAGATGNKSVTLGSSMNWVALLILIMPPVARTATATARPTGTAAGRKAAQGSASATAATSATATGRKSATATASASARAVDSGTGRKATSAASTASAQPVGTTAGHRAAAQGASAGATTSGTTAGFKTAAGNDFGTASTNATADGNKNANGIAFAQALVYTTATGEAGQEARFGAAFGHATTVATANGRKLAAGTASTSATSTSTAAGSKGAHGAAGAAASSATSVHAFKIAYGTAAATADAVATTAGEGDGGRPRPAHVAVGSRRVGSLQTGTGPTPRISTGSRSTTTIRKGS
jgi:hypothetical protein